MSAPALLVVRHAPVAVEGVCYGQSDVPTLVAPEAASGAIFEQLVAEGATVARVWTSPWQRAREPAAVLAARLGVPLVVDARLSELSFGEWEGRRWADLEEDARFAGWMKAWQEGAPPGGERIAELTARVRAWCRDARALGETALAVTHAGVVRVLRAEARGTGYEAVVEEAVTALKVERVGERPGAKAR